MSDRELLELAARAAGYALVWGEVYKIGDDQVDCTAIPYIKSDQPDVADWHWNSLTDPGDALRLAVALGLLVDCASHCARPLPDSICWQDGTGPDDTAATCRAITRAAAEIQKSASSTDLRG